MLASHSVTDPQPPFVGGGELDGRRPMRWGLPGLLVAIWLLTVLGGGACGLVFAAFELDFVNVTVPIGFVLGAIVGVPVAIALAAVIHRPRTPAEVASSGVAIQAVGVVMALGVTGPWVAYLALAGARLLDPPAARVIQFAPIGRGMVALLATALIGWGFGFVLARWVTAGYRPRA